MADEPGAEDLEDGELWLPSDFFSPDEANQVPDKTLSTCMNAFQRISTSNFLHLQPHNCGLCKPPTTLQLIRPADRYEISGVSGDIFYWTGCSQINQIQQMNPVQMETFLMGERARQLQNRLSTPAGHVGTGVFLPRVSNRMARAARNRNHRFIVKGPRTSNSNELHLPPRKILLNNKPDEHRGYFVAAVDDDVHVSYYWSY